MVKTVESLDINKNLDVITLSDGSSKLPIPKLSALRLIKIVKFLGVEAARIWDSAQDVAYDGSLNDQEKIIAILEQVPEEKLLGIISILTDLDDDSALALDINEILDIFLVYADKTNLPKTFLQIRNLYQKLFNKELPSFQEWWNKTAPQIQQLQAQSQTKEEEKVEAGNKA